MIPLSEYRSLLGEEGLNLSDSDVEVMRDDMRMLAEIIFEQWKKDNET